MRSFARRQRCAPSASRRSGLSMPLKASSFYEYEVAEEWLPPLHCECHDEPFLHHHTPRCTQCPYTGERVYYITSWYPDPVADDGRRFCFTVICEPCWLRRRAN